MQVRQDKMFLHTADLVQSDHNSSIPSVNCGIAMRIRAWPANINCCALLPGDLTADFEPMRRIHLELLPDPYALTFG